MKAAKSDQIFEKEFQGLLIKPYQLIPHLINTKRCAADINYIGKKAKTKWLCTKVGAEICEKDTIIPEFSQLIINFFYIFLNSNRVL